MEGYELWFGEFKGQILEMMAFNAKGWSYICRFLLQTLVRDNGFAERATSHKGDYKASNLYRRARLIRDALDTAVIVQLCSCGRSARYTVCEGSDECGFHFPNRLYCDDCKPSRVLEGQILLTTRFSEIVTFHHASDRAMAMRHYRWLIGRDRIMKRGRALKFFADRQMAVELQWAAEEEAKSLAARARRATEPAWPSVVPPGHK